MAVVRTWETLTKHDPKSVILFANLGSGPIKCLDAGLSS